MEQPGLDATKDRARRHAGRDGRLIDRDHTGAPFALRAPDPSGARAPSHDEHLVGLDRDLESPLRCHAMPPFWYGLRSWTRMFPASRLVWRQTLRWYGREVLTAVLQSV